MNSSRVGNATRTTTYCTDRVLLDISLCARCKFARLGFHLSHPPSLTKTMQACTCQASRSLRLRVISTAQRLPVRAFSHSTLLFFPSSHTASKPAAGTPPRRSRARARRNRLTDQVPVPAASATSSCPAGTRITGLNYLKDGADPIALEDAEYPAWVWTLLAPDTGKRGVKGVDDELRVAHKELKKKGRAAIKAANDLKG